MNIQQVYFNEWHNNEIFKLKMNKIFTKILNKKRPNMLDTITIKTLNVILYINIKLDNIGPEIKNIKPLRCSVIEVKIYKT